MVKNLEVKMLTTCIWASSLMRRMIKLLDVAEEVVEAVVDLDAAVLSRLVAEDKMLSRLSKRPRKTSPPYEVTEP
jgi:hypothetical protein